MRALFIGLLMLVSSQAYAASFEELEEALIAGQYDAAQEQIDALYRTKAVVTSPQVKTVGEYKRALMVFRLVAQSEKSAKAYLAKQTADAFLSMQGDYSVATGSASDNSPFAISSRVVDALNAKLGSAAALVESAQKKKEQAQAQATAKAAAEKAERDRQRQAAAAAEKAEAQKRDEEYKARLATERAAAAERAKQVEAQEAERKQEDERKLQIVQERVGRIGLKGVYSRGIVGFLAKVKDGTEKIENGVDYVFWSKINDNAYFYDSKFKVSQLFQGYVIYKILEFNRGESLDYTIAVPGDPQVTVLDGQKISNTCHVYKGTEKFSTVLGVTRVVPVFVALPDEVCSPKD